MTKEEALKWMTTHPVPDIDEPIADVRRYCEQMQVARAAFDADTRLAMIEAQLSELTVQLFLIGKAAKEML